jgi:DNA-binding NtrC family response regulator
MSPKHLNLLIVEDSEDDALLLTKHLKKAGYDLHVTRVETELTMRKALAQGSWEVIISDYRMPSFSGIAALKLLQESGIDIPFIIVSGAIGEETAVAAMKAGAHDYLIKGNLARLAPAIERELKEAQIRQERREMQQAKESFFTTLAHDLKTPIQAAGRKPHSRTPQDGRFWPPE